MNEQKAQVVAVHIHGAYYTNDHLSRFKTESDKLCPWCNKPDGIEHRLRCPELQVMRDKCKLPNDLNEEPPIFKHHNICAIPEEVWEVYRKQGKKTLLKPPAPVRDLTKLTIFVDGSCTDPTIALVRISSGATSNELPTFPSLKKKDPKKNRPSPRLQLCSLYTSSETHAATDGTPRNQPDFFLVPKIWRVY